MSPKHKQSDSENPDSTAVFVKTENWWIAYMSDIPGVNTQGRTLAEARANLAEALREMQELEQNP